MMSVQPAGRGWVAGSRRLTRLRGAWLTSCTAFGTLLSLAGCAAASPQAPWVSRHSLYHRLGRRPQIEKIVDRGLERARADPKLNFARRGTGNEWDDTPENTARLKERLTQYLCVATGGPEIYEGAKLPNAHAGMQITSEDVERFVAHFRAAVSEVGVPAAEAEELLNLLAATGRAFIDATRSIPAH